MSDINNNNGMNGHNNVNNSGENTPVEETKHIDINEVPDVDLFGLRNRQTTVADESQSKNADSSKKSAKKPKKKKRVKREFKATRRFFIFASFFTRSARFSEKKTTEVRPGIFS